MKMIAKLPLDGKNFKYVICNDGVRITGKLPITSELASLFICDLKLDLRVDGSHYGHYEVFLHEVAGKYYLSTEVNYLWGEFKGFRYSFYNILEFLKAVRRDLVDKYADTLAANYLNRLKNPKPTRCED